MRLVRRLLVPLGAGVIVWAALVVPLGIMLKLPDEPLSLREAVTVDGGGELSGDFLLMTVRLRRGTLAGVFRWLADDSVGMVPESSVVPRGEGYDEYFDRQREVFALSSQVAAAVALRAAGYEADPGAVVGAGVRVVSVIPGSPAEGLLRAGDVIVGVDASEVRDTGELGERIRAGDGTRVVRFERGGESHEVELEPARITLEDGSVIGIGVRVRTHRPRIELPVDVGVDSGNIGGPSAGLSIALTVYDRVSADVDLAAGRTVAATGSLDADGTIGRVGSMRQKVLAAHRSGAEIMVVPAGQVAEAQAALPPGSGTRVAGASTFDEAVGLLADASRRASLPGSIGHPPRSAPGGWTARSRATPHREPGQGRKAAAISGSRRVPRSRRVAARPAVATAGRARTQPQERGQWHTSPSTASTAPRASRRWSARST